MFRKLKPNIKQSIKNITAIDAFKLIEKHKNDPDFIIIDVRTPEEFSGEHIEGAKNINFFSTDFEKQLKNLDKEKICLIYCASGRRDAKSIEKMKNLGFKEVYNIKGGFKAIQKQ
jgi:rhodanese-related sulfurtransferase